MGDLFNTLNKPLPGRSSMPLEGQFLFCALSVLAIALYKKFPQKCSRVFGVLIAAKATAWAMYVCLIAIGDYGQLLASPL